MNRAGFSFIEILVAVVILGFTLLGAQAVLTDRLLTNVGHEDTRATALQLAEDRLQTIQAEPQYSTLESRYEGTEGSVTRFPDYRRLTFVTQQIDHTVVTVRVLTPMWSDTISRTVVVGAP